MKDLSLLVWFTQLGVSTALPLCGYVLLSLWLRNQFGWGAWVVVAGSIIGIVTAIDGFRTSLRTMEQMAKQTSDKEQD